MKRRDRKHCLGQPADRLRHWISHSPTPLRSLFETHGYLISPGYARQVLGENKVPGRHFAQAFFECTGVRLAPCGAQR